MAGLFLIARGNRAKVLELAEHAFDDMALLVHVQITASFRLALGGITAAMSRCPGQSSRALGSIPFVGQQCVHATNVLHKGNRLGKVCKTPAVVW